MAQAPLQTALVTGASRGVGYYTALSLMEAGCRVIAVARNEEGLHQLQKHSRHTPGISEPLVADVTDYEELAQKLAQKYSRLDILINNAAAFLKRDFLQLEPLHLQELYHSNVVAPLMLIKHLIPILGKGAHCINVSSVGGVMGSVKFEGLLPYSISKGALNIATECLAVDLLKYEIYCNAIALGSVQTDMFKTAFPGMEAGAKASNVGSFIAHFALQGVPLCNGQIIPVANSNP